MPYDSSLDKQLFTKSWEGEGTKISVSIYSYNNGVKKLQISRETFGAEGEPRSGDGSGWARNLSTLRPKVGRTSATSEAGPTDR